MKTASCALACPAQNTAAPEMDEIAFTGGVYDEETGLYYLMSRYYDPAIAQFISEDSYRGDGESFWNLYMYCEGDPVNRTDREGDKAKKNTISKTSTEYGKTTPYRISTNYYQNCYGYAIGLKEDSQIGQYRGRIVGNASLTNSRKLATVVIEDLRALGRKGRILGNKDSAVKRTEYRIALRCGKVRNKNSQFPNDYHFMKQHSDGTWSHKFSGSNSEPKGQFWSVDKNNWPSDGTATYDGNITFLAIT